MSPVRKLVVQRIPEAEWRPVARGIAVADLMASLPVWQGPIERLDLAFLIDGQNHRMRWRMEIEPRLYLPRVRHQCSLCGRIGYPDVCGRADSENRIKELKQDLSLNTFCLQSFDATDAVFRTGCVRSNLLMGFRETVLPSCWFERRLRAVRDLVFLVGADLIPTARRLRVRFAVPPEERAEFLQRLRTLSAGLPIAAQLDWELSETDDASPPPPKQADALVPALPLMPHAAGASP